MYHINGYPFIQETTHQKLLPKLREDIWRCNISPNNVYTILNRKLDFWSEVLTRWCEYNFFTSQNVNDIMEQIIWLNYYIRIYYKPVNNYKCWNSGLIRMADLYNSDKEVLSYNQIIRRFGSCTTFVEYYSLLEAILKLWKCIIRSSNFQHSTIMAHTHYDKLGIMGKITHVVYKKYYSKTFWLDEVTCKWEKLFDRPMLFGIHMQHL